jgi:glycosyltransferase involved in cell wall biosynthesis
MTPIDSDATRAVSGNAGELRILCLTSIFPNRLQPNKGIYNWRHFRHLQERAELRVISPIAWTDEWRAWRNGQGRLTSARPQEWNGLEVMYPRFLYTPGLMRGSYGSCLKMSIARTFRSAVAEFRPDLIYACWAYPDGWVAWKLAREAGLPVAVKVHGSDLLLIDDQPARKRRTIELLSDVNATSAVSDDLRRCAIRLGAPEQRTHLIYEGTDRELFCPGDRQTARRTLGLKPAGLRLLFVGNLLPVKAVDILIDACAQLQASGLQFEADLVGEGPLRAKLQEQITRLGLDERVRLRGRVLQTALPDWYRAADLVVLSSHSEGVPNVLVEAAACGTPFVSTAVGGIGEIAHLSPGELVVPGDSAALARAIEVKLRKAAEAAANVNHAAIMSTAGCAEATLQLFDELVAERRSVARDVSVACKSAFESIRD